MTVTKKEECEGEELPESFQPSKFDVIVGWARQNYHHEGNQMLRDIVRENVPRYLAAKTKHVKGEIIVEILQTIKARSPSGFGLLRQNPNTNRWYYIGTDKAKDKIGHALRKASREVSNGVTGSPVRQHHKRRGGNSNAPSGGAPPPPLPSLSRRPCSSLASPRSAFSSGSGMALKSFKTGPSITINGSNNNNNGRTALESLPLTSVTSLSSSESHGEESQRQQSHPVQVTVPSSPVTRPSSVASNPVAAPANGQHHHRHSYHGAAPLETHYEQGHRQGGGHHYHGPSSSSSSYHRGHHYLYHPKHSYGKEGHDYRHHQLYQSSYRPEDGRRYPEASHANLSSTVQPAILSDQSVPHSMHGQHHDQRRQYSNADMYPASSHYQQHHHQYEAFPPPSAEDGNFHRVFDEVDRRLQQEERRQQQQQQQREISYHEGHEHQYPRGCYPPTTFSHHHSSPSSYSRIVSHEEMATSQQPQQMMQQM